VCMGSFWLGMVVAMGLFGVCVVVMCVVGRKK